MPHDPHSYPRAGEHRHQRRETSASQPEPTHTTSDTAMSEEDRQLWEVIDQIVSRARYDNLSLALDYLQSRLHEPDDLRVRIMQELASVRTLRSIDTTRLINILTA